MENFDLKKYLAEGKLLNEEPKPYTDEIRRDEVDGLAADIELDGDAKQMFMGDLMKATEGESWDTFYDIADEIMSKYLAEGKLLKEDQMMGKYIQTKHPDGYDMIMSFSMPDEEELGLDYGTLDEILEVKEIDGVKVYCVYI